MKLNIKSSGMFKYLLTTSIEEPETLVDFFRLPVNMFTWLQMEIQFSVIK